MPVNAFGQFIPPRFCDSCRQHFEGMAHMIPWWPMMRVGDAIPRGTVTFTLCGDCNKNLESMSWESRKEFLNNLEIQEEG